MFMLDIVLCCEFHVSFERTIIVLSVRHLVSSFLTLRFSLLILSTLLLVYLMFVIWLGSLRWFLLRDCVS